MSNIFIVSDTHFGHANILRFTDSVTGERVRPHFDSVPEMDEFIIDRWNSVVKDGDLVYHLGDVYFNDGHRALHRLRGRKHLILGNHDNAKSTYIQCNFEKISLWKRLGEFNCLLTHVPTHESSLRGSEFNLHGHLHQKPSPSPRYINCSVELHNYTPKPIEELVPR